MVQHGIQSDPDIDGIESLVNRGLRQPTYDKSVVFWISRNTCELLKKALPTLSS